MVTTHTNTLSASAAYYVYRFRDFDCPCRAELRRRFSPVPGARTPTTFQAPTAYTLKKDLYEILPRWKSK